MKSEKIVWGLTLVFIGTILLLDNFGVIDFYWRSVWHFWPLILILTGLNLVFGRGNTSATGKSLMVIITCLVLGFVAYMGITHKNTESSGWSWSFKDDEETDSLENHTFSEDFNTTTQRAELNIEGGATSYTLNQSTDKLFEAEVSKSFGHYTLQKISRDSAEVLNFKMNGEKKNFNLDEIDANRADIRLNAKPIWRINLEMGAGKADFDLTPFKVENVQVKGGAASFEIKLGQPLKQTDVKIETGVAEVKLFIPQNAACQIKTDTGLSDNDFEGFEKQADGTYTTPNFNSAAPKFIIFLKGGLSDFEVSRY